MGTRPVHTLYTVWERDQYTHYIQYGNEASTHIIYSMGTRPLQHSVLTRIYRPKGTHDHAPHLKCSTQAWVNILVKFNVHQVLYSDSRQFKWLFKNMLVLGWSQKSQCWFWGRPKGHIRGPKGHISENPASALSM